LKGHEAQISKKVMKDVIAIHLEEYVKSGEAANEDCFGRVGLVDAAIVKAVRKTGCPVLTADLELCLVLENLGLPAFNFRNLRLNEAPL